MCPDPADIHRGSSVRTNTDSGRLLVGLLVVAVEGREVDVAEAPVKFAYEPRVVDDANGHLDDFLARDVRMVHFEATDESAWYATIELAGGAVWQLHFGADEPSRPGQSRAERVS